MKLRDLFEKQREISGSVVVSSKTTKLNYKGSYVMGDFDCSDTAITSLEGAPVHVGGYFWCTLTHITSLEGAPSHVGTDLFCYNTEITSLHNVHKQIKHIGGMLYLSNTIKSHILGVMFIKGLLKIEFFFGSDEQRYVAAIINRYLKGSRNPHECQEELIEAGLSEYAKL